ncbi:MAG: PHP domain-containing protein [Candidatus Helarchaeota archaeon]
MKLMHYLKKNKISTVLIGVFIVWVIFLIYFLINSRNNPQFIEVISQVNVSSEYKLEIPILRYLIEPIIGLTFILADVQFGLLLGVIIIYLIFRISCLILNRTILKDSKKHRILFIFVENTMNFFLISMLINLLLISIIFIIGYITYGFLFLNHNWQIILQWSIFFQICLLSAKVIYNFFIFYHPKKTLKSKKIKKFKDVRKNNEKIKWKWIKYIKIGLREFKFLIVVILFFIVILVSLLGTPFPTSKITALNLKDDEILIDFHVHTTMSDGFLTPEERVEWYIRQGLHGAAFTDHQNTRGAQRALNYVKNKGYDFIVIIGQEYTCTNPPIHLNIYGIEEDITPIEYEGDPYSPNCMNTSDMIKYVKNKGGYVIVNHYYAADDPAMPFNYTQLMLWGVDGFEVANSGHPYPDEIRQFCIANNLIMLSNTDEHTNRELVE